MCMKDQKGFSLVEVMLSMVILAMLSLPLMTFFANSAKNGTTAAQMQSTTLLADSILEKMKAQGTIAGMLSNGVNNAGISLGYGDLGDPDVISGQSIVETDGTLGVPGHMVYASSVSGSGTTWKITNKKDVYYLEERNITYGSHSFDARIEISTLGDSAKVDRYKTTSGGALDPQKVNDRLYPDIQLVGSGDSVSAMQSSDEADIAITNLKALLQSIDNKEAEDEFAVTNPDKDYLGNMPFRSFGTTDPTSKDDLGKTGPVHRTIRVDISPYENAGGVADLSRTVVTVWSEYSCKYTPITTAALEVCTARVRNTNMLRATILTSELKKVYLFLYSAAKTTLADSTEKAGVIGDDKDTTEITVSDAYSISDKPKPELYIVFQGGASVKPVQTQQHWKMNVSNAAVVSDIFTNVPYTQITSYDAGVVPKGELVLNQTTPTDRIVNLKVEIYDAGYLHTADYGEHLRSTFESTVALIR